MAQAPLTVAQMQAAVDAIARAGGIKLDAARALGINLSTFNHIARRAQVAGLTPSPGIEDPRNAEHMRHKVRRLEADLKAARGKQLDEQAVRDTIIKLVSKVAETATPEWALSARHGYSAPGVPTLMCSDWHWDEVVKASQVNGVNRFSREIAHERVKALVSSSIHLLRILSPKMEYPGIVVPLGGDMISGNIHDELVATNQFNTMPTILDILGVLKWMLTQFADTFGHVFVPCVTGNHGRNTHKIWSKDRHATSFDWLIYNLLAKHFEDAGDKRVQFLIPDGPDAYYRVYGHRYLLTHGDQFRGGDGMIGALGPIIRGDHKKRSRNAQIDMEYDTLLMGHWHQYVQLTRLIVNGSLKGYDEYAYNNNFGFEVPQQAMWITHPKYRITYRMPVIVDRLRQEPKTAWASVAK